MLDRFHELLYAIYPLSRHATDSIAVISEFKQFDKMDHIVKHNTNNSLEYIVVEGVCRSYISDYMGKEATLSFFLEGDVIPPNQIRTIDSCSLFNVQTLTPSIIACLGSKDFRTLMEESPEIEQWGRKVYDNELQNRVMKELDLITLSAKDRLNNFRKRFASLENHVPHPFIASYLGISPVSLSRLRGNA